MPIATTTFDIGFGAQCDLFRVGNLVIARGYVNTSNDNVRLPHVVDHLEAETCPDGYKPATGTSANVLGVNSYDAGSESTATCNWHIDPDGSIRFQCSKNLVKTHTYCVNYHGIWITGDAWPTT